MATVRFVPPRVPMVDVRTGIITREWYLLLQQLFDTSGSSAVPDDMIDSIGPSFNGDAFTSGLSNISGTLSGLAAEVGQTPSAAQSLAPDGDVSPSLAGIIGEIAMLRRDIDDLRKGTPVL